MSVVDELLEAGRRTAESLMDSTVIIRRENGTQRNTDTGKIETAWIVIYDGPARVRLGGSDPREVDVAGQRLIAQDPTVSLPIGADERINAGSSAAVRPDDVGTVTENEHDAGELGTTFRIVGRVGQTHSTARRLYVEVLSHG